MKYLILPLSLFLFFNVSMAQQNALGINIGVSAAFPIQKEKPSQDYIVQEVAWKRRTEVVDLNPGFSYLRFTASEKLFFTELNRLGYDKEITKTVQYKNGEEDKIIVNGADVKTIMTGLRLGFGFPVLNGDKEKLYFGSGMNIFYGWWKSASIISNYKQSSHGITPSLELFGMFVKELNANLKLTFFMPIKIYSFHYSWMHGPSQRTNQGPKWQTDHNSQFFPLNFELRTGLIYVFDKNEK